MSISDTLRWQMYSIIFIFFCGSLLHFTYAWSGYWKPAAVISAVNESVWEHLKLGFWPALIFSLIEALFLYHKVNNFVLAKACQLYIIPTAIIVLFYSYTAILGHHLLVLDILIFLLAIIIAQYVNYRILLSPLDYPVGNLIGGLFIIIAIMAFSMLSYYPLKMFLFIDPRTGSFGIPE